VYEGLLKGEQADVYFSRKRKATRRTKKAEKVARRTREK